MEHYSLLQPGPVVPVADGTRMILVRVREQATGCEVEHHVLQVVGIQPMVVHHYAHDKVAPIHPTPELMQQSGWSYQHIEIRYAPVFVTPEGKLLSADPHDPRWHLIEADTSEDRVLALIDTLKAREIERYEAERRLEEEEEIVGEVEED